MLLEPPASSNPFISVGQKKDRGCQCHEDDDVYHDDGDVDNKDNGW